MKKTPAQVPSEVKLLAAPVEPKRQADFQALRAAPPKSFWARELSAGHFLFSQLIILVLGLGFLGIIFYILNPNFMDQRSSYQTPITSAPLSLYLDINNPENELLTFDSAVVISGKTSPNATVIISTKDSDAGVSANGFGEFSKVFPLSVGNNVITINAFDDQGNSKTEVRGVYYSTEKI